MANILKFALLAVLCVFALTTAAPAGNDQLSRKQRAADNGTSGPPVCRGQTPCGWAVYTNYDRVIDYFMRNVCECPKDYACLRSTDDLSVKAYVYTCQERPSTTTSTTEATEADKS